MGVGDHVGLLDLHTEGLKPQILDIADDADRDDGPLGLQGLGLAAGFDLDGDTGLGLGEFLDRGADAELQPPALEGLARGGGDLFVLHRKNARQGFDHHHLSPQGAVEAGELNADGA